MKAMARFKLARRWTAVVGGWLLSAGIGLSQQPAPRPVVADVIVAGSRNLTRERLLRSIVTRPGAPYDQETVNEDIRRLIASGLVRNVQPQVQPTADGRVEVYFSVVEFPSVVKQVVYEGAHAIKKDELETLTGVRKGMPLNPITNRMACRAIARRYNELGMPFAACELTEGDQPGDERVVFNVTEGPKVKISSIDFVGNDFVSGPVLKTHVNASQRILMLFGGTYNGTMIDFDVLKLEEYYRSYGFHDVRVSRELQWNPDGKTVKLVFHIREGVRYRLGGSEVLGAKAFPVEELQQLSLARKGDFFNQNKIDVDKRRMEDWYGYTGRPVNIREEKFYPPDQPGVVQVQYQVQERQPFRVGEVKVIGNDVTRESVIRNQLALANVLPGQILSFPDLRVAERNLTRLGIFEANPERGVRPTVGVLDLEGDNPFKDVVVQVQETTTGSLIFGLGVNSDSGFTGSVVLNERNFDILRPPTSFEDLLSGRAFRGGGQEFRLEAVPGSQVQRYTATFREPFLFQSEYSLDTSGYYYTRFFDEYSESRLGGRVTVGRRFGNYWNGSAGLRVEQVGVRDFLPGAPSDFQDAKGDNFLVGLRGAVAYDTRDSYLRPTEGMRVEFSFEQCLGDYTFPIGTLEANRYFTVYERADNSGRHVLAARSQLSIAGSDTPVFERFYAGGYRSLRGFEFRGVGPEKRGQFGGDFKVGGTFLFLNSLEYQVPLTANDQILAVAFLDSGTVERNVAFRDYRVTAGFGFRFTVPMLGPVPIALDFGFPIVQAPGDREQIFSFWLGFFR